MARIRTIKPEFFTSADIVELTPLSRLLYISLWCESDREGRLSWNVKTLKMRYLPADDCSVEELAKELVEQGLIKIYEVDGKNYAEIPSFKSHQVINNREKDSEIPEYIDAPLTRERGVKAEGRKEGKGKEGKGNKKEIIKEKEDFHHMTYVSLSFTPCSEALEDIERKNLDKDDVIKSFINNYTASKHKSADWKAKFLAYVANARPNNQKEKEARAEDDPLYGVDYGQNRT